MIGLFYGLQTDLSYFWINIKDFMTFKLLILKKQTHNKSVTPTFCGF